MYAARNGGEISCAVDVADRLALENTADLKAQKLRTKGVLQGFVKISGQDNKYPAQFRLLSVQRVPNRTDQLLLNGVLSYKLPPGIHFSLKLNQKISLKVKSFSLNFAANGEQGHFLCSP